MTDLYAPELPETDPAERLDWLADLLHAIETRPYGQAVLKWHQGKVTDLDLVEKRRYQE